MKIKATSVIMTGADKILQKDEEKKMKKWTMGISAVLMAAMVLSGCGKQQTADAADETAVQTEETQTEETQDEDQAEAEEAEGAEEEMPGDEEIPSDIPNSFVEEQAGKTEFDSYDDLISNMTAGQAYAYVTLTGYEGDVLLITDETYDDNGSTAAMMVYVYLEENGKVKFATIVGGSDTAYPVRYADNVLYTAGSDEFCSYFVSEETQGVMVKDSVMESVDENGAASYIGFLREKNNFDNDEEIDTDSDQIFKEKMAEYDAAAVVDFTVVE